MLFIWTKTTKMISKEHPLWFKVVGMLQEQHRPDHLVLTNRELMELFSDDRGKEYVTQNLLPALATEGQIHAVHEEWKTRLQAGE